MITTAAVRVPLPTPFGVFEVHAFERASGHVYVAMVLGDIGDGEDVLVRLHSECLTGDALGSLRCDCGIQLRLALRTIAAEQRGVLVYATGHEGRGIGLVNKLRAYVAQDDGADTVDANVGLGLPVDSRDYTESAAVLAELGIRTVRLLTNNPGKVDGLLSAGAVINGVVPLPTAPHYRNVGYLNTKAERMDHVRPTGLPLSTDHQVESGPPIDTMALLGEIRSRPDRPFVVLKYAQTLDGRIATSTGDSKWISGVAERRVSHALRAACDAVLVGVGTVMSDDPELTVRMVSGASPMRVVLDSNLRISSDAKILGPDAATTVITTERSDPARRAALRERGVRVEVVADQAGRVSLRAALATLRASGTESVLVEGGSEMITGLLAAGLVDRIIVGVAPVVIGSGTQAVNDLRVWSVADGIRLENRSILPVGEDVVLAWDVVGPEQQSIN
jgi:3,4-dihydroxy 2-butanone 4-phosphate synthase/GTP cyclohydrolase II